jgi:hypothetical protein
MNIRGREQDNETIYIGGKESMLKHPSNREPDTKVS